MRILHVMFADPKFEAHAKNFFDCDDFDNEWALFAYNKESKQDRKDVYDFPSWEEQPKLKQHFEHKASQNDVLLVHFLIPGSLPFLRELQKHIPIVIQFWGGDYVGQYAKPADIFLPLTLAHLSTSANKTSRLRRLLGNARGFIAAKFARNHVSDALSLAAGFMTILPEELDLFPSKWHSKHLNARVIYGNFEDSPTLNDQRNRKMILMLGNSANPSNNQVDYLDVLSGCLTQIDHLILPLSYGNTSYGDWVEQKFQASGLRTTILRNLIPAKEYERITDEVDVFIMGQLRQQGLGNILQALFKGKTVYLNPKGVNFKYFHSRGFSVFDTNNLQSGIELIPSEGQFQNAQLVKKFWNQKQARNDMYCALTTVVKEWSR